MTPDELRSVLNALTPAQRSALNEAVGTGGGDESVEGRVQAFVYDADRPKLEQVYAHRLKQLFPGIRILTEAEKASQAAVASADANQRAARAAERSANFAKDSAESARASVDEARKARRMSTLAVIAAVAALLLQAVQIASCLTK